MTEGVNLIKQTKGDMQGHAKHQRLGASKSKSSHEQVDVSGMVPVDMDEVFGIETDITRLRGCALKSALTNRGYRLRENKAMKYHYEIVAPPGHLEYRRTVEKPIKESARSRKKGRMSVSKRTRKSVIERSDESEKHENSDEKVIEDSPIPDLSKGGSTSSVEDRKSVV